LRITAVIRQRAEIGIRTDDIAVRSIDQAAGMGTIFDQVVIISDRDCLLVAIPVGGVGDDRIEQV
jgi:hypothetical protein